MLASNKDVCRSLVTLRCFGQAALARPPKGDHASGQPRDQGQLRECLGIDNNAELREIADLYKAVEFNKWTTSRCSVEIMGVSEPRVALLQISLSSSALEACQLELFGRRSQDHHHINTSSSSHHHKKTHVELGETKMDAAKGQRRACMTSTPSWS